ncbi:alanine racemase [Microbacterium protaetiae]|nr:alanine racemase [Microbacterium protaetiae]
MLGTTAPSIRTAPSTVTLSHDAVAANTARMVSLAGVPVMGVVKADGFGLGAASMARAVLAGGASELGVATCDEALALRAQGINVPLMAWLLHEGAPVAEALAADVAVSCATAPQVRQVAAAAREAGCRGIVELEVDTGMHRSGAAPAEWPELFHAARDAERAGALVVRGVWTHLGSTTPDPGTFDDPIARLERAVALAVGCGLRPMRRHAASSLAAVVAPRARLDLVRLGASLLGIEPVSAAPVGLAPAVRWTTRIVQTHAIAAGERVGYGGDYRAEHDGAVALLPVGYADGVPRSVSPGATVVIGGRRAPLIGAVSMDQCVVDIGHLNGVAAGDPVVLIGTRAGEPSLAEWARLSGTIAQEVLTRLGPRVARGGQEEA